MVPFLSAQHSRTRKFKMVFDRSGVVHSRVGRAGRYGICEVFCLRVLRWIWVCLSYVWTWCCCCFQSDVLLVHSALGLGKACAVRSPALEAPVALICTQQVFLFLISEMQWLFLKMLLKKGWPGERWSRSDWNFGFSLPMTSKVKMIHSLLIFTSLLARE